MNTVILLSGGLDSAVCLAIARQSKPAPQVLALSFDYGQTHKVELTRAAQIAHHYAVRHKIVTVDVGFNSSLTGEGHIETDGKTNRQGLPSTFVPGRNLLFLSYAVAEAGKGGEVYIGVNQLDFSGYPDCRGAFIDAYRRTVRHAFDGNGPTILTPLLHHTKERIITTGLNLNAPLELTVSCYQPSVVNHAIIECGLCDACIIKQRAWQAVA